MFMYYIMYKLLYEGELIIYGSYFVLCSGVGSIGIYLSDFILAKYKTITNNICCIINCIFKYNIVMLIQLQVD